MNQLVKAGEKQMRFSDPAKINTAHYKNKQGPQNSEPLVFKECLH